MRHLVPDPVIHSIRRHLVKESSHRAEGGWPYANGDEDALDQLSSFRHSGRPSGSRSEHTSSGAWRWKATYKHLGGRDRLEKYLGADGIVQIEVEYPNGRVVSKGLLFQAKKGRRGPSIDLESQIHRMEALCPGASAVFQYNPDGFVAARAREVQAAGRIDAMSDLNKSRPVGQFLGKEFVGCLVGRRGL